MSCDLGIFDIRKLSEMALAATLVIAGIVFKRSTAQIYQSDSTSGLKRLLELSGVGLYVAGLGLIGHNLHQIMPENKKIFVPALVGIALSEIVGDLFDVPALAIDFIFSTSWLALGYVVSSHLAGGYRWIGMAAALISLVANQFVLPYQRKHKIVDGFGLPLYLLAWSIVAIVISIPSLEDLKVKGWECLPFIKANVPELSGAIGDFQCAEEKGCFKGVGKLDATELGKIASCAFSKGCV